ncbi:MAG: hypothetical protein M1541_10980 [Acidobacteria bacterium]|nr:hypothetical protein [Acidobacteriota bacterium]
MSGDPNIPRFPWKCSTGYVTGRPFEIAAFHPFDDHHGYTDARDIQPANHSAFLRGGGWDGEMGSLRGSYFSQAEFPGKLSRFPGFIKLRIQVHGQAVSQS